jgi:hypothetical protein
VIKFASIEIIFLSSISAAHAGYIRDTLVGGVLLGNSGEGTELAALQALTGSKDLTLDFKMDFGANGFGSAVQNAGTADQWFLDSGAATSGYFLLKFGIGGTNATADTFFFHNIGELNKLVWSNDQVQFLTGGDCRNGKDNACNIGRLSHYVEASGLTVEVPEPATVLLFGLGLFGFAIARRKSS